MDCNEQQPCPSPCLKPFKDVSNFKTPKRPSSLPKFTSRSPQFFTASKRTPVSSFRPSLSGRRRSRPKPTESAARRRLKEFEMEQSQSSRKAQIKKEQSLKSLAKSLSTWLNFLFENPSACGCSCNFTQDEGQNVGVPSVVGLLGKREGGAAIWRSPKRIRDATWQGGGVVGGDDELLNLKRYGKLKEGLKEVCSMEDLIERMRVFLNLRCIKEVFDAINLVVKTIDEGRLKMKPHCPIVTDIGMKEKAIRILMCYNPIWLRIGLHMILGGDSLWPNGDVNSDEEISFLKMVIEKQFLTHAGLAKAYAYNKKVEGLYRQGYYESLGNVLLKRFLLLVLILDRAKLQNGLSLKYGIDGVDGGSPLLFTVQSSIKSSRQMIDDFLSSEVMHGEGNLLAHLVIVGYKVSYQQYPLVEYAFKVTDLFADFQDGVRLSRAIQLLQNDSSILMKLVVPSDTRKKSLANCGIALQYLKRAGVTLQDEDGMTITEEDVVNGDKELTVSLLWNTFVHLQLPLLLNKTTLANEIMKIHGVTVDNSSNDSRSSSALELLLNWIQAVCVKYEYEIKNFDSLVDGKAIWCLLDYYFRKELSCSRASKDPHESRAEESLMSAIDYTDAVHNFLLSQKLTALLWNFPEVLQISDILEHSGAINHRSVVILLVFLSSQLTEKKTMDRLNFHKLLCCDCQERNSSVGRCSMSSETVLDQEIIHGSNIEDAAWKFRAIKAWWQGMAERNNKSVTKPATSIFECISTCNLSISIQRENAAKVIQSHFRRSIEHCNFLKMRNAGLFLQTVIRAWLLVKQKPALLNFSGVMVQAYTYANLNQSDHLRRYVKFFVDRHRFVELRRAVVLIQKATRIWLRRRRKNDRVRNFGVSTIDLVNASIVQKYFRGWEARSRHTAVQLERASSSSFQFNDLAFQLSSKTVISRSLKDKQLSATKIQSHFRSWQLRKTFLIQKQAVMKIQRNYRCLRCRMAFQQFRIERSAIAIQSCLRRWIARKKVERYRYLIGVLQRYCRGWLVRRDFLLQREAVVEIQSAIICLNCSKAFNSHRHATIEIQRFIRGQITRNRLLGASHFCGGIVNYGNFHSGVSFWSSELEVVISSVLKLQRWWRGILLLKLKKKSAINIQAHIRGWIDRRMASRQRQCVSLQREAATKIQSAVRCLNCWKAFHHCQDAAIEIQGFIRGEITRKRLIGASRFHSAAATYSNFQTSRLCLESLELKIVMASILKLQRWWRGILMLKLRTKSAIIIQSHVRGWMGRKKASREMQRVVVLQSYWKGCLARKKARGQLLDLRLRVQNSAKNVDDSMRIINRLIVALSELSSMKSVSGILHTCATLDMATEHSQKCCEELVAAGAIDNLLKLIRSVSRSIPDQEVLKHALSVLRNLARYQHLIEVLINSQGSVETILQQLLRNKEEGYFIASDVMKKIFSNQKGVEAVVRTPALLKRLHSLVEELARKANFERKKPRNVAVRENTERRFLAAVELLKLINS